MGRDGDVNEAILLLRHVMLCGAHGTVATVGACLLTSAGRMSLRSGWWLRGGIAPRDAALGPVRVLGYAGFKPLRD